MWKLEAELRAEQRLKGDPLYINEINEIHQFQGNIELGSLLIKSSIELVELAVDQLVDQRVDYVELFGSLARSLEQAMLDFTCQELDLPTRKDLNIQREAERLANGGFSEDRWVDFFRTFFFNPLLQHASVSGGRSRMSSRCQYYYDSIVFDTDAIWGTFDKNKEENEVFKTPKPDLVFYLPMYHLDTYIPTITDHEAQQWHKASTPSLVEPFSWSTLKKLHGCGLLATPFNVLNKKEPQEPREPREQDLSCFPWLVVEYKKAKNAPGELDRLKLFTAKQPMPVDALSN
ncbi:Uncharacterized protein HZ326_27277 [Fusarium oxysporum f. sp. albedinis]|nr:Uncharacterized protein HZ326_27277 [Fusarium oxysporum f. sp. albedinis]